MKPKLLLIGKKSFISKILFKFLKDKIVIKKISYEEFKNLDIKFFKKFTHVCNCSITKQYQKNKYSKENDIDIKIINKIKKIKSTYIFLSSRKIYFLKDNIKENSKLEPKCNYSKNKIITEQKIKKIIPNNYIILRISNIIGKDYGIKSKRKISNTFINNFYKFRKKKKKVYYENFYKDFLSEKQFSSIFNEVLKKKLKGTYNVSLGEKVFISEILLALNKNKISKKFVKLNYVTNDNFFLNNKKLLKKIKVKLNKKDLLNYCHNM